MDSGNSAHGLPSVAYHLFERNATAYQFEFTLQYVTGQIITCRAFDWLAHVACGIHENTIDQFEKTLKWTTLGIFGLFLVATLKGRSEANWTVPAFVGLIVLAHQHLIEKQSLRKWVYWLLAPSLILVLVTRIYMMADVKPQSWLKKDEFHKTSEWARAIKDSADGLPGSVPQLLSARFAILVLHRRHFICLELCSIPQEQL